MTPEERRIKYRQYLLAVKVSGGYVSKDTLKLLTDAMDVTEKDIHRLVDEIVADNSLESQTLRFMLLGEDLRDYRDSMQIKSSRSDILRESLDNSDDEYNERYMFLG